MVMAGEFIELAERYQVSGVPHTVINHGNGEMVGAGPEQYLVAEIEKALKL